MSYRISLAGIILALLLPVSVGAAEPNLLLFTFSTEPKAGEVFTAQVAVRYNEAINAIGVSITYDPKSLEFLGASDAGSVVRMWIQRPSAVDGVITMEGAIPGGLQPVLTDRAPITTLRFRALREGATQLRGAAPQLFAHQPQTRLLPTLPTTQTVTVRGIGSSTPLPSAYPVSNELSVIDIEGAGWFLAYDIRTSDGSVGTVRMRERFLGLPLGSWRDAVSPERLSDQRRLSILDVEVIDTAPVQRFRVISWPLWLAWGVIIVVLGAVLMYTIRRRT